MSDTATETTEEPPKKPKRTGPLAHSPKSLIWTMAILVVLTISLKVTTPFEPSTAFPDHDTFMAELDAKAALARSSAGRVGGLGASPADIDLLNAANASHATDANDTSDSVEATDAPQAEPIVSESAGYATSDSLLLAVSPGLLVALINGADDAAMTDWVANALGFMPPSVVQGWAAAEGAGSPADLASLLTDYEAADLARYVRGGTLRLVPGNLCTADELSAITERFNAYGANLTITSVYEVNILTSEYPSSVSESQLNPQGLYEKETPYYAVECGDAWFFYTDSFVRR